MDQQAHEAARDVGARPAHLTSEDLAAYERDGFVVPNFRLSDDEVGRLRELIAKLVADNPTLADHVMNSAHVPGSGVQGLKSGSGWMEFGAHPAILDMIEQIIGPDIVLWGSATFYKRAGKGPATPWHRDATYIPIKPLRSMSVWIAASDSLIDNSCLRFIRGSHKTNHAGKHRQERRKDWSISLTIDQGEYDEAQAVDVELKAGQMVIFEGFTIHGSRHNLGNRERASLALRFMPATSLFDHDGTPDELRNNEYGHHTRPLILVRGIDRAGNDFRRGHPDRAGA
jgi:hypothetical protein